MVVKKTDVIFCGLPRKPDMFKKSIKDLIDLQKKGLVNKIIFSTWKNQVEKVRGLDDFLKKNKITVIKSIQPKKEVPGHIWHQMKAYENGLKKAGKNTYILKTRTDLYFNKNFLKKLLSEKEKILKIKRNLRGGNVFKEKVWVPYFELTRPFFMSDECFLVSGADAKKLLNYNKIYYTKYAIGPGICHLMRLIEPFRKKYPKEIDAYLSKFNDDRPGKSYFYKNWRKTYLFLKKFMFIRKLSEKQRFYVLRKRLRNLEFVKYLGLYYAALYSQFHIELPKNGIVFREWFVQKKELDPRHAENNYSEKKVGEESGGQIFVYNLKFINNLVEGKVKKTPISENIRNSIVKYLK